MKALIAALAVVVADRSFAQPVIVTFEGSNAQGWTGPQGPGGATTLDPSGGNPGGCLHTVFNNFGITFASSTSAPFVGNYGQYQSVTIAVDLKVDRVEFFGTPVGRDWILELRDRDNPPGGYPWVSV